MTFLIITLLGFLAAGERQQDSNPQADPHAVVFHGRARFTILTPGALRLEWAADSLFEDRASLVVVNRSLPLPEFSTTVSGTTLTIATGALTLTHRDDGRPFDSLNTRITFSTGSMQGMWVPGLVDTANLLGTTRTLDGADGDLITRDSTHVTLEPGLLSRSGWTLIDDSARPLFDDSPWPWVTPRPSGQRSEEHTSELQSLG